MWFTKGSVRRHSVAPASLLKAALKAKVSSAFYPTDKSRSTTSSEQSPSRTVVASGYMIPPLDGSVMNASNVVDDPLLAVGELDGSMLRSSATATLRPKLNLSKHMPAEKLQAPIIEVREADDISSSTAMVPSKAEKAVVPAVQVTQSNKQHASRASTTKPTPLKQASSKDASPAPAAVKIPDAIDDAPTTPKPTPKFRKFVKFLKKLIDKLVRSNTHDDPMKDDKGKAEIEEEDKGKDVNDKKDKETGEDMDEDARCQWWKLREIPSTTFKTLLRSTREANDALAVAVRKTTHGSYHAAVFMKVLKPSGQTERFIIKIPGHGTPDRWTPEDQFMFTREVELIKYIRQHTKIPVPEIIAYCGFLDSQWGFPYIIMRQLPGQDATEVFFDGPYDSETAYLNADIPSLQVEKKRLTFLRSLAGYMSELERIRFDGIGMPRVFPAPFFVEEEPLPEIHTVGKSYLWNNPEDYHHVEARQPFASIQDYVNSEKDKIIMPEVEEDCEDISKCQERGHRILLDIVFSHPVFQSQPSDTFVIQHDDLDLQNILTDTDGNITGIIDWDGSLAMPRCIGPAAAPKFLCRDWLPSDLSIRPHLGWRTPHYRAIYAAAMLEAGSADAQYTTKSGIYFAAFAMLHGRGDRDDFIEKLLRSIPHFLMSAGEVEYRLGKGWRAGEQMLRSEISKLLTPEMPDLGIWDKVETELGMAEWWSDFDGLIEEEEKSGKETETGEQQKIEKETEEKKE